MKIVRVRVVLVVLILLLCWVATTQELQRNPAVGVVEEFTSAYNAKNLAKLVSLYRRTRSWSPKRESPKGTKPYRLAWALACKKGTPSRRSIQPRARVRASSATPRAAPISLVAASISVVDIS